MFSFAETSSGFLSVKRWMENYTLPHLRQEEGYRRGCQQRHARRRQRRRHHRHQRPSRRRPIGSPSMRAERCNLCIHPLVSCPISAVSRPHHLHKALRSMLARLLFHRIVRVALVPRQALRFSRRAHRQRCCRPGPPLTPLKTLQQQRWRSAVRVCWT